MKILSLNFTTFICDKNVVWQSLDYDYGMIYDIVGFELLMELRRNVDCFILELRLWKPIFSGFIEMVDNI